MLGLLSDIKGYVSQIFQLGDWLILGAALAFLGAMFQRWLGYAGVAVSGAIIMFLAITGHWLGDDSNRIKRLEAELQTKKLELAVEQATGDQLQMDLAREIEVSITNADIVDNLQQQINAMEDTPECGVSEEFTDELKKLR
jgi:hypothetical protein